MSPQQLPRQAPQYPTIADDYDWLAELIDRGRWHAEHLTDSQIRFLDDMLVKTGRFGAQTFFSVKQRNFARSIETALDRAEVPRDRDEWEAH